MKKLKFTFILLKLTLLLMAGGCNDNKANNSIKLTDKPSLKPVFKTPNTEINPASIMQAITLEKETLESFESCHISERLLDTRKDLIANHKPAQTSNGYLSYNVKTEFLNLPVKEIIFGICLTGEPTLTDCSFVKDIALILDIGFIEAKAQLKENSGIDFSKEKRADLNGTKDGPTLRPILYEGAEETTVLHCDSGGL